MDPKFYPIAFLVVTLLFLNETHGGLHPELKKLSHEIQEKVCSGKTTEQQLNDLTKCIEDIKSESEDREQLESNVQECLKEIESLDIGFTVDEKNKESVYMICSSKFRSCMHQKMREMWQNKDNDEDLEDLDGEEKGAKRPPPREMESFQKLMQCKREALEI